MANLYDVYEGMKVFWDSIPTLTESFDGPWLNERPPVDQLPGGAKFPYIVITTVVPSSKAHQTDVHEHWEHTIQFRLFDKTPELVVAGLKSLGPIWDNSTLDLGAGKKVISKHFADQDITALDKNLHLGTITYTYLTEQPRRIVTPG